MISPSIDCTRIEKARITEKPRKVGIFTRAGEAAVLAQFQT